MCFRPEPFRRAPPRLKAPLPGFRFSLSGGVAAGMAARKEGSGAAGGGFGASKGKGKAAASGDAAVKQVQIDGLVSARPGGPGEQRRPRGPGSFPQRLGGCQPLPLSLPLLCSRALAWCFLRACPVLRGGVGGVGKRAGFAFIPCAFNLLCPSGRNSPCLISKRQKARVKLF